MTPILNQKMVDYRLKQILNQFIYKNSGFIYKKLINHQV